jgi:protein-tyrosine phosphatase
MNDIIGEALRTLIAGDESLGGSKVDGNYTWPMLAMGRMYRCGKIDYCSMEELHNPATIMNLRMGDDPHEHKTVTYLQIAAANNVEKYDTKDPEVRTWLTDVLNSIATMDTPARWPIIIHCRSGRDRTGVVVACLLTLLGVPDALIRAEFAMSRAAPLPLIELSLQGWQNAGGLTAYFRRKVDLTKVRNNLLMNIAPSAAVPTTTTTLAPR